MKNRNRIYWQEDKVGLIMDHLDADVHSHWMLQLFLCAEDDLNINVAGNHFKCKCIVVNKNVPHSFHADKKVHFSYLIEPTSDYAEQLSLKMNNDEYWICDFNGISDLQRHLRNLVDSPDEKEYLKFVEELNTCLGITQINRIYDDRVRDLLKRLESCTCDNHAIAEIADKTALSSSRLSHLFKEQTGVPLKSYILLHQMKRAFKELLNGKNITEAAMTAGFDSPSHFAGVVKRMMGMPASLSLKDSEFLQVSKV